MVSFRKVIDRAMMFQVGVSCLGENMYLVTAKEDTDGSQSQFAYDLNEALQLIPWVRTQWDARQAGDSTFTQRVDSH